MKKIITEKIEKNNVVTTSASANVALGKNWVKKMPRGNGFTAGEIAQAKVMSLYPQYFPETMLKVVKHDNTNKVIVLQKKLNIGRQEHYYLLISQKLEQLVDWSLRSILELIADTGRIDSKFANVDLSDDQLQDFYHQYIEIAKGINNIFKKHTDIFYNSADLHSENFGLDGEKIKCIDFISPYTPKRKVENIRRGDEKDGLTFDQVRIKHEHEQITWYGLAFLFDVVYHTNFTTGYGFTGRTKSNLTADGVKFIRTLSEFTGKKVWDYGDSNEQQDQLMLNKENLRLTLNVFKSYFPSSNLTNLKQWLYFFYNYYNIKIEHDNPPQKKVDIAKDAEDNPFAVKSKGKSNDTIYSKDLFNKVNTIKDTTKEEQFIESLSELGIPITLKENKNMKEIIKSIITEAIKHNEFNDDGDSSDVYIGDKWVKKVNRGNPYSNKELYQFKLMQKYANLGIFPATKIKFKRDGTPVIVQEKIDVSKQKEIFNQIDSYINEIDELEIIGGLYALLDGVTEYGVTGKYKRYYQALQVELPEKLKGYLDQYVHIANLIRSITKAEKMDRFEHMFDVNIGNFGMKGDKILIIDFLM